MKIIVPMAGIGKRLRPHTLTIPKPLIPIAGKPIVQRLVEEIMKVSRNKIDEIAYIIGDFGKEAEESLRDISRSLGADPKIYYQNEPLGTAHAIYCAKESLNGKVIVAFADTLFKADFTLDEDADSIVCVQKVKDPRPFGVVKTDRNNIITDFIEKPKKFVSDLAIIGIYYFKDGARLKEEIKYLIDNNIMGNNEYQLTDALENMKNKGVQLKTDQVNEWLDCGNKNATVYTNQRILEHIDKDKLIAASAKIVNSVVIAPCFIGENVVIENSVLGPHLSVGYNTIIKNSILKNSIIQRNSKIEGLTIQNSMVGNFVDIKGDITEVNIGDYTSMTK